MLDRKSTRLNSSHLVISYAVFCLKKKKHDSPMVGLRLTNTLSSLSYVARVPGRVLCATRAVGCGARCSVGFCGSFFFFFLKRGPPPTLPPPPPPPPPRD